ncbi:MAG TPA: PAS domain-containing protein, partial [Ramlibacter sp.]|nr:PAS domain-containing protein [Ramlibacter sp.]
MNIIDVRAGRHPWLIVGAALACALALTVAVVHGARHALAQQSHAVFERRADTLESEIGRRLHALDSVLKGARAAYAVSGRMNDADLRAYMDRRNLDQDVANVFGMGIVEQAPSGAFILRSVQPLPRNLPVLRQNVSATPSDRDLIALATDTGMSALSVPTRLLQDPGHRLGWTMLLPIYRGRPDTVDERRVSLIGFAYVAAVAEDMLSPVAELHGTALRYRLYDGPPEDGGLLFDSLAGRSGDADAKRTQRPLLVGNRLLTLQFESTAALQSSAGGFIPAAIACGGVVLSLLLALSAWLLLSGKRRALEMAARMTADSRRMALIVERTTGGAFVADAQGKITWANHGFEDLVGRSQGSILGRSMAQLMGEVSDLAPQQRKEVGRELLAGRSQRVEAQGLRLDGRAFWADVEAQPMLDDNGNVSGYMGIALDISERKRAELLVQANDHLVRGITDNLPAHISYWDAQLTCRFVNRAFCEFFGVAREAMAGRALSGEMLGADAFGQMAPHIERVLQGVPQQFEMVFDAPARHSTWQAHYVPDVVDGVVNGFFAVANDVTELQEARDHALTASQAKSRFLSSMSHEIRTPMNAIMGMLALLQQAGLDGRQKEYASKAEGAARALLSLLNDILDLSKIEAGKMELDCRPFSMETLLGDVSVVLSASVGDRDLEVLYEIDPQLPQRLMGDDLRLRQIVINLAGNAVKFTPAGEVVVQVKLLERLPGAVRLELAVRDTGIGISEHERKLLFEDYAQASGATARTFGGTGLGLGICRRLAAMMNSQLRLESV